MSFCYSDMFASQSRTESIITDTVGLTGKVEDVNMYQAAGALAVVGTVAGATMTMAYVAPLPTLGGLAAGGGLLYTGHRVKTGKTKAIKSSDSSKSIPESESDSDSSTDQA